MSLPRLLIRDFVAPRQSHHFARVKIGPIDLKNRHRHDFPELFWVEEGRGIHVLGEDRREIESGTLIFVRPEEAHVVGAGASGGRVVIGNLAFPAPFWRTFHRRHSAVTADWFRLGAAALRERRVGAGTLGFLRRAGVELAGAPRSLHLLERFLLNLAFVLSGPEEKADELPGWLRDAAARTERERLFQEGGPVLARISGHSAAHVAREVRRFLGKTPTDWVNEMRMRHAARLLAETRREILDVCLDCGIENVGHFYALFRHHHGMTPLAYRRRSRLIVRPA